MEEIQAIISLQQKLHEKDDLRILVDQFLIHGRDSMRYPESTMKPRATHMNHFIRFCSIVGISSISQVSNILIDVFFAEIGKAKKNGKTLKDSYINAMRRTMRSFIEWINEYKEMSISASAEKIKLVGEPRALPKVIDHDIIRVVVHQSDVEQDALMIALFYEAGLRIAELTNLLVADIDHDAIHVRGKGEKDRTVYITDKLARDISDFIIRNGRYGSSYLFQHIYSGYGDQMTTKCVRRRVKNCFRRIIGLEMHPHMLRHSFAYNLLVSGCDIVTIKNLMGHQDVNTTMIYLGLPNSTVKSIYRKHMGRSIML